MPEIAALLGVLQTSAKSYVQRAFAKLGVRTRRELAQWALWQPVQSEGHTRSR